MSHRNRAHVELAPSAAHRWIPCGASIRLTRGLPEESSIYADEGTGAHELAQRCLVQDCDAHAFIGQSFGPLLVTAEVAAQVQIYLSKCREIIDVCDFHQIEQRLDLAPLNPPTEMGGTVDLVAYSSKRRTVHVADLKFGKGVFVETKENQQLLYYALAATLAVPGPVSAATLHIVQPRYGRDPVRSWSCSADFLAEWSMHFFERARIALRPDAPAVAGPWCRFCGAKSSCVAYQQTKTAEAFRQFQIVDARATGPDID